MDMARLFQNGKSQAVRLPKEYRFQGSQVYIKRMGNAIVLIPEQESWQTLLDSLAMFSEDFMDERDQPATDPRSISFE
jgi:antitoxin VapB